MHFYKQILAFLLSPKCVRDNPININDYKLSLSIKLLV